MLPFLLACVHPTTPSPAEFEALPILPSPRGALYTRAPGVPRDPVVASVADGLPWDEALSGVSAAIALAELGGERVDACRARWMAVIAGYPYAIRGWRTASLAKGLLPDALIEEAHTHLGASSDVGLVRARSAEQERWVLVMADRTIDLPPIPREVAVGVEVPLGDAEWLVTNPLGEVVRARGAARLDAQGEWLLTAVQGGTALVSLPVYVGEPPPESPPYRCVAGSGTAQDRAMAAIDYVRASYGYAPLTHDGALDSVARARLKAHLAGDPVPDATASLRAAGFVDVPVAAASCNAAGVEACVAQIWWSAEGRAALVGDLRDIGFAVSEDAGRVRMVILGAG